MAAATAARALVLSVRAAHARHVGWWRGLVGRANGGMIVHLGVVVLAIGVIAATSYRHQAELALHRGTVVTYDGHTFEFEGVRTVTSPSRTSQEALVKVDGAMFAPATTSFGSAISEEVGTPAIDSGFSGDVYLTFDAVGGLGADVGQPGHQQPAAGLGGHRRRDRAAGGVALGGRPADRDRRHPGLACPGSRRRATDPASAPSALVTDAPPGEGADQGASDRRRATSGTTAPEPVGALVARGLAPRMT